MMRVGPPQAHFVACPKLLVGFGPLSMSRRCHFARADRGPMLHLQKNKQRVGAAAECAERGFRALGMRCGMCLKWCYSLMQWYIEPSGSVLRVCKMSVRTWAVCGAAANLPPYSSSSVSTPAVSFARKSSRMVWMAPM